MNFSLIADVIENGCKNKNNKGGGKDKNHENRCFKQRK